VKQCDEHDNQQFPLSFRPNTGPAKNIRKPTIQKKSPKGKSPLLDARSKIIQRKRLHIRDARERIAENARKSIKDARELLSTKKPKIPAGRLPKKAAMPRSRPGARSLKGIAADLLMDDDDDDFDMEDFNIKPIGAIKRTVRNDIAYRAAPPPPSMPKMPHFSISKDLSRLSPDPFDCYVVPTRRPIPVPPIRAERPERGYQAGRPMSAHMDAYEPRKSILRPSQRDEHDDRFDDDRYFSSAGARARLNEPRDRNESAGIFAKLPVRGSSPPPAQVGHRIIISNLHTSVTESDVAELFEDVGPLVSAHLVRPGIAEVVYKNLGDAEEAVETYHNRQLDGQPMKCMLVRSSAKPSYSRL
jgi:polymerase delta-interacting protein 3